MYTVTAQRILRKQPPLHCTELHHFTERSAYVELISYSGKWLTHTLFMRRGNGWLCLIHSGLGPIVTWHQGMLLSRSVCQPSSRIPETGVCQPWWTTLRDTIGKKQQPLVALRQLRNYANKTSTHCTVPFHETTHNKRKTVMICVCTPRMGKRMNVLKSSKLMFFMQMLRKIINSTWYVSS